MKKEPRDQTLLPKVLLLLGSLSTLKGMSAERTLRLRASCPFLPQLGPENTMMSFEKAVEEGAFGLESDVHIR